MRWTVGLLAFVKAPLACAAAIDGRTTCTELDLRVEVEVKASELSVKFEQMRRDVKNMRSTFEIAASKGGVVHPVLSRDMCIPPRPNFVGYHDCNPDRDMGLFYGDVAMNDSNDVFVGNRTIDTDLAFGNIGYTIFPGIVQGQNEAQGGSDQQSFYLSAMFFSAGSIFAAYNDGGIPNGYVGDIVGADFDHDRMLQSCSCMPENRTDGSIGWSPPSIVAMFFPGLVVLLPFHYSGEFFGHNFQNEYVGFLSISVRLAQVEAIAEQLNLTQKALPMVVNDAGNILGAPKNVLEIIFGPGTDLIKATLCGGELYSRVITVSPCSILTSTTGEWGKLMDGILASAKEEALTLPDLLSVPHDGVVTPHRATVYRFDGEKSPPASVVILWPVEDVVGEARWEVNDTISASAGSFEEVVQTTFTFANIGPVELTLKLDQIPDFVTVHRPLGDGYGQRHEVVLPPGELLEYQISLEGKSGGTHKQLFRWTVEDHGWSHKCVRQERVSMEVVFEVPSRISDELLGVLLPVMFCLAGLLVLIVLFLFARYLYTSRARLLKLKRQKEELDKEKVEAAWQAMEQMGFPIHLLETPVFLGLGRMVAFESLRDSGSLKVFDQVHSLKDVRFVFISHQWTSWKGPDPTGKQYKAMCSGIEHLQTQNPVFESCDNHKGFVWADYSCIPQVHPEIQLMAIRSLPVYASNAAAFVVAAPAVEHSDTTEVCDITSYMDRAWCRAEQASFWLAKGSYKDMYLADENGTTGIEGEHMAKALQVFSGNLTCCRLKHRGNMRCDKERLVVPILGLYGVYHRKQTRMGNDEPQSDESRSIIHTSDAKELMPSHFIFETEQGSETKELFGDLVDKMVSSAGFRRPSVTSQCSEEVMEE